MTFTENDVAFMLPENVKARAIQEADEYLKKIQNNISKVIPDDKHEILQTAFSAGYKTAFINLLQMLESCNEGVQ